MLLSSHLHDAIRLLRILVFLNILLQLRERHLAIAVLPCAAGIPRGELVQDLAQQLMRNQRRVFVVAYDYAGDALAASIGMEGVRLLLDILSLAGSGALCYGFAEEGHEFADAATGEAGEGGEFAFGAEFDGWLVFILEDLVVMVRDMRWRWDGCGIRVRRCKRAS